MLEILVSFGNKLRNKIIYDIYENLDYNYFIKHLFLKNYNNKKTLTNVINKLKK